MSCPDSFWIGVVAGGPLWISGGLLVVVAVKVFTGWLDRRLERNRQLSSPHLNLLFRKDDAP